MTAVYPFHPGKPLTTRQSASLAARGFTLVEMLVAIALMALLSLIGWRALDAIERGSERLFSHADDTMALVRVVGQLEHDIRQYAGSDVLPAPDDAPAPPLPGIVLGLQDVQVIRAAADGSWQQVRWFLENGALRRAVGGASSRLPLPDAGRADTVLEHVRDFRVRAWVSGRGWVTPPLPASRTALTIRGLEIQVVREATQADAATYRKLTLLP